MNNVIEAIMGKITADKGRDVNRSLVLVLVVWCAFQIGEIKERVVVIETRLNHAAARSTNEVYGIVKNATHQIGRR